MSNLDGLPEIFWEIHSNLPREGPGDNTSTRKAFSMLNGLPDAPRVLDVGCGPGMQTLELARISHGRITALDAHQPFLEELASRAKNAGLDQRISPVRASMFAMPFPSTCFDLIWSEGAMYFLGLREALAAWKPLLAGEGYIVATEPCWLKDDISDALKAFWGEYPAMTTIENAIRIIEEMGYRDAGHFILPESAWWDDYYVPIEKKLPLLKEKHQNNPAALKIINEMQYEIDAYRAHSDSYGYVFFVMQRKV
jgi:SAM-dependent methyltransferase